MEFVDIREAAQLLGLSPYKLRQAESADGNWTLVHGVRLRVFRLGPTINAKRRYRRTDLLALLRSQAAGATEEYGR